MQRKNIRDITRENRLYISLIMIVCIAGIVSAIRFGALIDEFFEDRAVLPFFILTGILLLFVMPALLFRPDN
jgi:high-affinity Fe2+/Pb2+ permease